MGALPWVRCTLQKDSDLPGGGVALELSSTDVGMDVTSYKIFLNQAMLLGMRLQRICRDCP